MGTFRFAFQNVNPDPPFEEFALRFTADQLDSLSPYNIPIVFRSLCCHLLRGLPVDGRLRSGRGDGSMRR